MRKYLVVSKESWNVISSPVPMQTGLAIMKAQADTTLIPAEMLIELVDIKGWTVHFCDLAGWAWTWAGPFETRDLALEFARNRQAVYAAAGAAVAISS